MEKNSSPVFCVRCAYHFNVGDAHFCSYDCGRELNLVTGKWTTKNPKECWAERSRQDKYGCGSVGMNYTPKYESTGQDTSGFDWEKHELRKLYYETK